MKLITFFSVFITANAFAHELSPQQLNVKDAISSMNQAVSNVSKAGDPPECNSCLADGSYTMAAALADIKSDALKFVGRDYPYNSLGAGGNLSCFFENSKVYVELEGCRPNRTQKMGAFRAKIFNKDGRTVDVYVDNENAPYTVDKPFDSQMWALQMTEGTPIKSNLSFAEISKYSVTSAQNYNLPLCSYKKGFSACRNGGVDSNGNLQREWQNPGDLVRKINDAIMAVPR